MMKPSSRRVQKYLNAFDVNNMTQWSSRQDNTGTSNNDRSCCKRLSIVYPFIVAINFKGDALKQNNNNEYYIMLNNNMQHYTYTFLNFPRSFFIFLYAWKTALLLYFNCN